MSLAHVARAMVLARRLSNEGHRVTFATGAHHQKLAGQEGFDPLLVHCVPPERAQVNNNVILVDAPKEVRLQRLMSCADIDEQEALAKIDRQISSNERKTMLEQRINEYRWGRLWAINNDEQSLRIDHIVDEIVSLAQP